MILLPEGDVFRDVVHPTTALEPDDGGYQGSNRR
jgi:hypothetical protein